MLVFCIIFGSYYFNIRMAKKRVSVWKTYSTYMFLRSNGLAGVKNRANLVWMKVFGYDERDAIILAKYQTRANFCAFVLGAVVLWIAASLIER